MLFGAVLLTEIRVNKDVIRAWRTTPSSDCLLDFSSRFGVSGPAPISVYSTIEMHLILVHFKFHFALKALEEGCVVVDEGDRCPAVPSINFTKFLLLVSRQLHVR